MRGCSRGAVVLLVLSLLFSSAQCMMACAVAPCQSSSQNDLPPCHRHAPASQAPSACSYPATLVNAGHSPITPDLAAVALFPPVDYLLPSHTIEEAATIHTGSPPGIIPLSTFILRI